MMKRSAIKAIESLRIDLNILKLHCGNRVRDAVFRKIAEISKDSNIEMFQKEVLLKLRGGVHFLQRHLPVYYEEVVSKVVFQIFSEYYTALVRGRGVMASLQKRVYEIGCADDLIVVGIGGIGET